MGPVSPATAVFAIVITVLFAGAVVAFFRDRIRFRRYQALAEPALRLAKLLNGDVFRDGPDLAITGNYHRRPVTIRFSHQETTPALNIRLGAPTTFDMTVAPARAHGKGRALVRVPDEMLNLRHACRSDQPTQAKLFVDRPRVVQALKKLCSSQVGLRIGEGHIEYSEMGIVDRSTGLKVFECLEQLGLLADELLTMPGAQTVRVETVETQGRKATFRLVLALGMLGGLAAVAIIGHNPGLAPPLPAAAAELVPPGVWPVDALHIPGIADWYLASATEFDSNALGWARAQGLHLHTRIPADFSGAGRNRDVVYVLANNAGERRVVLLINGNNRYDVKFKSLALAAVIPQQLIGSIRWSARPPQPPDGDALLLVRSTADTGSGTVMYLHGAQIISGVPANYETIKLE